MTTHFSFAILALSLGGCASSLPAWTSAQVGCPTDEVVITREEVVWSNRTWTARCRGRTYACTEHNEAQTGAQVSCKESGDYVPEATSSAKRACHFDTECSSDSKCQGGYCVAPAPAAPDPAPAP